MYPFLINALQECGFSVDVATMHDIDPGLIKKQHGVSIRDINVIKFPRITCIGYALLCEALNSTVSSTKFLNLMMNYDVTYMDTPYVGPLLRLPRHSNMVYYLHAPIERKRPVTPLAKPHRMFLLAYMALGTSYELVRRSRVVFANSKFTARITEKTLGIKPRVLYPPVDINLVAKYRSTDREDAIVSFARISSAKGHEFAIRMTKELIKDGLSVKTYIMGSANDYASKLYLVRLMRLTKDLGIEHNVSFVINPEINEAYKILGKSKVFIHAREREPFGITIVEAMAAGAVPLVPRSGAPWHEIVEYGKYGIGYSSLNEAVHAVKYLLDRGYHEYSSRVMQRSRIFSVSIFNDSLCSIIKEFRII